MTRHVRGMVWGLAVAGALVLAFAGLLGSGVLAGSGGGSSDIETQWAVSGHANEELAKEEATVEMRQAGAASCARCHASQGFQAWVAQLQAGQPGNLLGPDGKPASVEYMQSLGLTTAQVKPIDCDACHTETYELRIAGSTPMLPSGFAAHGVGSGALCMTCHNTRNGKVAWNATDPGRFTAPHHSAQADVIMGQNAYFVNVDAASFISPHAAFTGDACVTCHFELGEDGHKFEASRKVCVDCHGPEYTAARVEGPTRELLARTAKAYNERFMALYASKVKTADLWDPDTDKTSAGAPLDGTSIAGVELTAIHGQQGLKMTLRDGQVVYSQLAGLKGSDGKPVVPTSDPLVRGAWNYLMILWDGSYGVHNPAYTRAVLLATESALAQRP
ncbi:hypothetical protein U7230_07855 [Carboxydochorda subterranea]|uniref:Uncharacterized protein n=1 Tax=Carboxydichorda subterranea TaxID=3109565 RepID=A0ABZ1BTB9_9FIRM|nr:hypothetical protein [Limnochorda sp. L945t]WRP16024.1 hypothetical protein U7230_07855 [Limnochorda sp. L945t]